MSITPGYKAKRRFMQTAIFTTGNTKGEDYIAAGNTPAAIQTKGLATDPWVTEQISRDLDDGLNGAQPVIHTGEMITISGSVEMTGAGAVNTAVPYSSLLVMSGLEIDLDTTDRVTYNRLTQAIHEKDGTCYFHWEGLYHKLIAGKASLSVSSKVGEIGYIGFEIKGVYAGTVSGLMPSADFSAFVLPEEFSKANTAFTLDGQALNAIEFEMAQNNAIELDEGTEKKQVFIDDWAEEGKVIIEQPELSTFDPFAIARTNTFVPYEFIQGTTAGNIFKMASTGVQIMSIKPGEHKGKATWELTLRVIRGNDSIITTM